MKQIQGFGGGGGKGGGGGSSHVASEAPDSLRSTAYAQVLDLICEGEIEGLVNGEESIFLDETPLKNADGTYNFSNVTWASRNGTQAQAYIPGFSDVENTVAVNVEVKAATPVVRSFTNANLDAIRVTVAIPQLSNQDTTNGDINGTSVQIAIDLQTAGGGWVQQDVGGRDVFSGKTTSRYQRSYRIPVAGAGPWDIRIRRLSADSTSSALQNKTFWDAYTEIIDAKLRYPNSALIGLSVDASQFSSIPSRSYDMKLLRIRVPSNYNPTTRAYAGPWDGTFQIAWSDNPAWCFYDLLTSDRYGLGEFIDATQVDKWALYAIGKYCDELVPNGLGGTEPRFTCNLYLQTKADAFKVVNDMASIFRGLVFWSSGAITAIQDAPSDPAYLFNQANVIDGAFNYSGSSAKARHTVALVTWNDMADFGRQKVEYVEDRTGISRYGVINSEVAAIGCTSRGQANRVGRWMLFSERLESETVTFKTGLEGFIARPGQVIKVADPNRAGIRMGGRITSSTTTAIGLDSAVTLTAGQTYTFMCLNSQGVEQEATVDHSGGTLSTLNLSPSLAEAPVVGSVWIVSSTAVEAQTFRVVAVVENDKHQFEITALAHDPEKFDAVENNLILEPRNYSVLSASPGTPTELSVVESLYNTAGGIRTRLSVSWSPVAGASSYIVTYQRAGGNMSAEMTTYTPSIDISDVLDGFTTIYVASANALGTRCVVPGNVTYQVLGKTAPPADVTNFTVSRNGDVLNFSWLHIADLDRDHYEIRKGTNWNTGQPIGATIGNVFSVSSPRGGSFMVKAFDTSGNESALETVTTVSDISGINVVVDYDDGAAVFPGVKSHTALNSGGIILASDDTWSSWTQPWATYTDPWIFINPALSGTYTTPAIDVGYSVSAQVYLDSTVTYIAKSTLTWATYTDPWAAYAPPAWTWLGQTPNTTASYEIATSADNITWSAWVPFTPGTYTARYYKIRVTMTTDNPAYLPKLTELVVHIDVPDRVEHFEDVSIPLAGATISFTPAFVGVQTVQVTLQSATSGDRFTVTGKSDSSVTVKVFDSAGSPKTGLVDVDVFGYGERS